jgi:hypothetical protein
VSDSCQAVTLPMLEVAEKSLAKVKKVQKPLKHLFKDLQISPGAIEISKDEIRLFQKKKR